MNVKSFQCKGIRTTIEVKVESLLEEAVRGDLGEEGHRRVELEVVGRVEDFMSGTAFDGQDEASAFAQAFAEDAMAEVGDGFLAGGDGELAGCGAAAEAGDLREDEPHPVGAFAAGPKFFEDVGVDGVLSLEEAVEVVGIRRHVGLP